jgi:hypothetical protein
VTPFRVTVTEVGFAPEYVPTSPTPTDAPEPAAAF